MNEKLIDSILQKESVEVSKFSKFWNENKDGIFNILTGLGNIFLALFCIVSAFFIMKYLTFKLTFFLIIGFVGLVILLIIAHEWGKETRRMREARKRRGY